MPDLSARLAHLEALRDGAWPQPWHAERNGGEIEVYGPEEADDDRGPLATFDCSENADLAIDLVNASPWLIPLAQQAEKLAEALGQNIQGTHSTGCRQSEDPLQRLDTIVCVRCQGLSALAAYQAIVKEAENV